MLEGGAFAARWTHIARAFGIAVVRLEVPWGRAIEPAEVAAILNEHRDAVAVFGTLMESSTGVAHDIEAIGRVVKPTGALFIVDAISGAGCVACETDAWGIDVLVVGSQKALMLPPGLAFLGVSEAAWRRLDEYEPSAFYFNLKHYRANLRGFKPGEGPDTPWSPAVSLVVALAECLRLIRAEGVEAIWRRCDRLGRATRAGVAALGLEPFAERPAAGMTAVRFPRPTKIDSPTGFDGGAMLRRLESRFGLKLAAGQVRLKGHIFRIAHFGQIDELDILSTLAALEIVLVEMGREVKLGAAVAAASAVLIERDQQGG